MAQVDEPVHRQPQAVLRAELGELALAAVQRAAPGGQVALASGSGRRSASGPVASTREQQAGFLEALAHRGDVVVEPAVRQAEPHAGGGVVEAGATGVAVAVAGVDHAAGEDPGAAVVVAALGAPQQQHLDADGGVAHDHERGGGARAPRAGSRRRGIGAAGIMVVWDGGAQTPV